MPSHAKLMERHIDAYNRHSIEAEKFLYQDKLKEAAAEAFKASQRLNLAAAEQKQIKEMKRG